MVQSWLMASAEVSGRPQLGWVVLYVDDVAAAVATWEAAFGLATRFVHESGQYAELETGATALALCARSLVSETTGVAIDRGPSPASNVTLVVADVPAAYARATASGATPIHEPVIKPWGQVSSYVMDGDGNLVELATAIS